MEQLPHKAAIICAHLLRQGYLKKSLVPTLELDEQLFAEVRKNLAQVGMELVYNTYSPYYAVRLNPEAQETVEQSNNLGLKNNEVAMLVILWCKLILPKRLNEEQAPLATSGGDSGELTAQGEPGEKAPPVGENGRAGAETQPPLAKDGKGEDRIFLRLNELYAEFGEHFGSKTTFKAVITRLSNLQFIRIHNEIITEGILLDLLVDGYQMANEIKKSALAFKLAGIGEEEWEEELEAEWEEEEEGEKDEKAQE